MVEEQATLAELQRIADEVSEAFHRPTWKIVVDNKGARRSAKISSRRVVVTRLWLATAEPAKLRFGLVLFEVSKASGFYAVSSIAPWVLTVIAFAYILQAPELIKLGVPPVVVLGVSILLLVGSWAHPALAAFVRRRLISDAFLHRLLEASKDPEAMRDYLKRVKVSAKTLAKFEAMVAAQGYGAPG